MEPVTLAMGGTVDHDSQATPAWRREIDIDQIHAAKSVPWEYAKTNNEEFDPMTWLHLLSYFLGGAFLANAVPHSVSGMLGRPFQTPFARPPGEGLSSSTVNVLWGLSNAVAGYVLVCRVGAFAWKDTGDALALGAGVLLIALFSARHFGRFHGGNTPGHP